MSRVWVRAALSAAIAAILFSVVPFGEVWQALRGVKPWVWIPAAGIFGVGHTLNALKFRLVIGPDAVSSAACLKAHFAGIAANFGLPGVAGGDLVRAGYLVPSAGAARVALAAVVDRVVDACGLALLVGAAALAVDLPDALSAWSRVAAWWLLAVAVAAAALTVVLWRRRRPSHRLPALASAWSDMRRRPGAVGLALAMTMLVQSGFVVTHVWLASEVDLAIGIAPWFVAWAGAKLSAMLPISLGGLGVREAALVSLLAVYGAAPEAALAVGILWDAAMIVGGLSGFVLTQALRR